MNKKVLFGIALLAVGAYMYKDQLFGGSTTKTGNTPLLPGGGSGHPYEGMVLSSSSPNEYGGWDKIINGKRVVYQSTVAWQKDGSIPLTIVSTAELLAIPDSGMAIFDNGEYKKR